MTRREGAARALAAGAALGALALALVPLLATPRVSDDVINYSFRWLSGPAFMDAFREEVRHWLLTSGRVFVVTLYMKDTVFKVFETAPAYKAFLVVMNLGCAAAFFAWLRLATRSWLAAALAVLALAVLLQLRAYHDPVVSFNGQFQLSAGLVFASLAFHLRHLETGESRWIAAAMAAFVLNLLVYELAAITLVLIAAQEWALRGVSPRRFRATRIALVLFAAYFALIVAARFVGTHVFGLHGTIYGLGLSPAAIAATFAKQVLAVVPFSYALLRPPEGAWDVFALPAFPSWLASWQFAVGLPAFAALAWVAMRAARRADARGAEIAAPRLDARALALLAAVLVALPAGVIALLGRYQAEFGWGNGYSAVYYQMYGAAIAFGLVLERGLRRRHAAAAPAALAIVFGVAAAGNLANNGAVASRLAQAWAPQDAWVGMLRSPDLRALCADVPLVVMEHRPWAEYRVIRHAGFGHMSAADLAQARAQPGAGAFEACVARAAVLLDRPGTAFARVRFAPGATPEVRSPVMLVLPLGPRESRNELHPGARCGDARALPLAADWAAAGRRYALFALPPPAPISHPAILALPCE